ncbi:cytochrome c oxidase assembly protein [Peteryoungia ipomoeae]|uniref:Cytochrome c oxidase assembly protein n=1 Tax=Peteryoungia ipomoeae TaxID=1210932 RepID=A0A4S8NVL9_9HYPH|nr:cytochrome c oxidase assembly protein [Peteryoungia ipomoeae]THV20212.1 cytochrome c oxidase assembly protein [Peteryoungia ipomoeae]
MNLDIYCGPAPTPDAVWSAWNFDPPLLLMIAAAFAILITLASGSRQRLAAIAALIIMLIAFVSPLCALASALFSARIFHHILIVSVLGPLIVMAIPLRLRPGRRLPPQLSFLVHTLSMWFWHAPEPYLLALSSPVIYWLMELSLIGSAIWLWADIVSPRRAAGSAIALLLGTTLQMGMLGALLTFSRQPLFAAHMDTTLAFGLSPLADQQLAGLLMWVPAALPYLFAALLILRRVFAGRGLDGEASSR